jgi:ketosteroid isomerase-like protein
MAEHPNVARIRDGYAAFSTGDFAALNELFADDILWHVGGRNQFARDYHGREEVYQLFGTMAEASGGTFAIELHAVLADDEHGLAMVVTRASRDGRSFEIKEVHAFHLRDGKATEFWNASTDEYAGDELFG